MYDFEKRQQFISNRALGKSIRSIAAMLNIHRNTAQSWDNEYNNEIKGERRCVIGLALAASGAGRIDRAKRSAEILNRLTNKLLEDGAPSAQMDTQMFASYIKLCQLLDKADAPVAPDPDEPRCDLPLTIDFLAHVKRPVRPEKDGQPAPERTPEPVKDECRSAIPGEIQEGKSGETEDSNSDDMGEENIKENERDGAEAMQETLERRTEEPVEKPLSPMGQVWEKHEAFMGQK